MIDILMPRLSDTMTEGTIAAWQKKPGDRVEVGDVLVEIETDKALMEQEAYDAGVLVEILVPEGENADIGTPIARLDDGRTIDEPRVGPDDTSAPDSVQPVPPEDAVPAPAPPAPGDEPSLRRRANPLVRRLARERGIDLTGISGSGPGGRIVRADLPETAPPGPPLAAPPSFTVPTAPVPAAPVPTAPVTSAEDLRGSTRVAFDAVRQTVAARLTASALEIPTFTVTGSADVGELLSLRLMINAARADGGGRISVNDLLIRAAALACRAHPAVNASYDSEGRGHVLLHGRVNVGFAVASPAGLVVPVVHDADRAPVSSIAADARKLIDKASERRLTSAEMSDGTFTISNLGMFGVDHFTAIINPPQGAILAVGSAREELFMADGQVQTRQRLTFTLTADHRIIDGADAARFLATFTGLLENPLQVVS